MSAASPDSPAPTTARRPPRASATVIVVRDGMDGLEVLLCQRADRGDHNSNAWVFPGGIVEDADREAYGACCGLDDAEASRRLGVASDGLAYYVTAIRECFEESGLLFACDASGTLVNLDDDAEARLDAWPGPLHRGERSIGALCAETGLRLATDRLAYYSHWLTPLANPKRFDTRFFIAAAPPAQTSAHDGTELVQQRWMRPADALAASAALKLITPTRKSLEFLTGFADVQAVLDWAARPREVVRVFPRIGTGARGPRPVLPDEPAYAEIGRIDPDATGTASYEIQPDRPVRLSARVIRVTADNGSVMTGPGTNTYLVGSEAADAWAVIDPGPPDPAHVAAVLAAAPGPIRWIFVTHTHKDHSPATVALHEATGATVHGRVADHPEWQDTTFVPDVTLHGGERIPLVPGATLRVLHTPGHASNHLCYLLEEERTLFTGDHVMQASTVVINPPDGNMAAYIGALRALLELDLEWLAPGHGFLMPEPRRALQAIIDHRLRREARVVAALDAHAGAADADLLPVVYADVPERLHPVALRSLRAHLEKLEADGLARCDGGRWMRAPGPAAPPV